MRRSLGRRLAVLATVMAVPARAEHATVATAALSWVRAPGAESCPAEADVARSIEQRLGRLVLVPAAKAELVLEAELAALPAGGFRADISMRRGEEVVGRRDLESENPSCQVVAENAALVIALAIDPEASLEPLPIEPARAETSKPPPPPPTTPVSSEAPKPVAPPAPAHAVPWQGDLELAGGVAAGIVPKLGAGVFARGRALPPRLPFGIELESAFFPARSVEAEPGKGAHFSEFYAGAALCSRPERASRFRVSVCAGADAGLVAGRGYGFDVTPNFRTWTFALAVRARLGFRVTRGLALVAGPDLLLPLKRDYFEVTTANGTEQLFRMSAVGAAFELGVVWEL